MRKLCFIIITFIVSFDLLSQENNCDCNGPVRVTTQIPIFCSVLYDYSLATSPQYLWSLDMFSESNVPGNFFSTFKTEIRRLQPASTILCNDISNLSGYSLWGWALPPTNVYESDGYCSIKVSNNYEFDIIDAPAITLYFYSYNYDPATNSSPTSISLEGDIVLNTFNPDYPNISYVSSFGNSVIDFPTIIRHELGHFYGAAHDPDFGTLMYESIGYGTIRDIDCDIQDAYDNLYNCSISKNTSLCPNYKSLFGLDVLYLKTKNGISFSKYNDNVISVNLFKKEGDKYLFVNSITDFDNKSFKVSDFSDLYYQISYEGSVSKIFKVD